MALPALPDTSAAGVQSAETTRLPRNVLDPIWHRFLSQLLKSVSERTTMVTSSTTPTTSDIPANESRIWKNTGAGTVRLYVNDGGTLKSVVLS